jgi:N6-adenosine-specific RNA methylase IME4
MIEHIGKQYEIILADPAWPYGFSRSISRKIENHYQTMSLGEIMDQPVDAIAAENAVLFLWVTAPKLPDGLRVMESWGFEYKTNAVWDKEKLGLGYYFRLQHEHLLIGTKGTMATPDPSVRPRSVIRSPRGKHSVKPTVVHEYLERMYPNRTRIELFARSVRPGWAAWGDEVGV